MKIIAFIMAFIIMALNCVPCMDNANAIGHEKAKQEITAEHSPYGNDCTDNCSPFCSCSCCAGFVIKPCIVMATAPVLPAVEWLATYLPANISGISLPVWQPPQLS